MTKNPYTLPTACELVPDLDRMFKQYDKPFSELYGIPSDKKSCPIAEECRRLYEKAKEKK